MRRFLSSVVALTLLFQPMLGWTASSFDLFYDEAKRSNANARPSPLIVDFVIREMRHWGTRGIILTSDDIDAALDGNQQRLCNGKVDATKGEKVTLLLGSGPGATCTGLQVAILNLIQGERESEALGTDLLTIANGAELAVSDEPHRLFSMPLLASLLRKVWTGIGATAIPWSGAADPEVKDLESALMGEDLDAAVLRFNHGYFRDQREADPRFQTVAVPVADALKALAAKLGITGDWKATGDFVTPPLKNVPNVSLWARKDDLGLQWTIPSHYARLTIGEGGTFPTKRSFSSQPAAADALAYPFSYEGFTPPPTGVVSPLCSRTNGRQGYLCRPLPPTASPCSAPSDPTKITLLKCSDVGTTSADGPQVCPTFKGLFKDDGTPLLDASGHVNPLLKQADKGTICSPEKKVLYAAGIPSNACYVGLCLRQSMVEHTLIPARDAVLIPEQTAPYAACLRPDPQLGVYTEIATDSPYPLPQYIGHLLIRDFDREFCAQNGDPPMVAGLCTLRDQSHAELPDVRQGYQGVVTEQDLAWMTGVQDSVRFAAQTIGERAALNQTIEVERKIFASLAHFVQEIGNLLQSLKMAPITKTPCPWTGPFRNP